MSRVHECTCTVHPPSAILNPITGWIRGGGGGAIASPPQKKKNGFKANTNILSFYRVGYKTFFFFQCLQNWRTKYQKQIILQTRWVAVCHLSSNTLIWQRYILFCFVLFYFPGLIKQLLFNSFIYLWTKSLTNSLASSIFMHLEFHLFHGVPKGKRDFMKIKLSQFHALRWSSRGREWPASQEIEF